jgi:hypothetical protein
MEDPLIEYVITQLVESPSYLSYAWPVWLLFNVVCLVIVFFWLCCVHQTHTLDEFNTSVPSVGFEETQFHFGKTDPHVDTKAPNAQATFDGSFERPVVSATLQAGLESSPNALFFGKVDPGVDTRAPMEEMSFDGSFERPVVAATLQTGLESSPNAQFFGNVDPGLDTRAPDAQVTMTMNGSLEPPITSLTLQSGLESIPSASLVDQVKLENFYWEFWTGIPSVVNIQLLIELCIR